MTDEKNGSAAAGPAGGSPPPFDLSDDFWSIAQSSPVGIFRTDAEGSTTYVNPSWCAISGIDAREALGHGWLRGLHDEDRARITAEWDRASSKLELSKAEYRYVRPDGGVVWVQGQATPQLDAAGRTIGYVGTVTDITELKRVEFELLRGIRVSSAMRACGYAIARASDEGSLLAEFLDLLVEKAGYGSAWIAYRDPPGGALFVAASRGLSGPGRGERAGGSGGPEAVAASSGSTSVCPDLGALADPGPMHRAAAAAGLAACVALPLGGMKEPPFGALVAYARDPADFGPDEVSFLGELALELGFGVAGLRARAANDRDAAALRESEAGYRFLFEHNPVPMLIYERATFRLLAVNEAFETHYGYSREEALSMSLPDLYPEEEKGRILELAPRLTGLRYVGEWHHYKKDGSLITILATSHDLARGGREARVAVLTDVTELKRAERRVISGMAEKEVLLREIHHRVNNNIQVVIALMNMQAEDAADAPTRGFLRDLEGRLRAMASLYEQLSRSKSLSSVPMADYLETLAGAARISAPEACGAGISVSSAPASLSIETALPCGIVVNELLSNSLRHAFPPGFAGEREIEVRFRERGGGYSLAVIDAGIGFPAGFDWRASKSLGMRLVRICAEEQLCGRVEVASGPGGTSFEVVFDATKEAEAAPLSSNMEASGRDLPFPGDRR